MLIMKIKHILIIALVSVSLSSLVAMENLLNAQADNEQVLKVYLSANARSNARYLKFTKKIMQMITVGKEMVFLLPHWNNFCLQQLQKICDKLLLIIRK